MVRLHRRKAQSRRIPETRDEGEHHAAESIPFMIVHREIHTRQDYFIESSFLKLKSSFYDKIPVQAYGFPPCDMNTAVAALIVTAVLDLEVGP